MAFGFSQQGTRYLALQKAQPKNNLNSSREISNTCDNISKQPSCVFQATSRIHIQNVLNFALFEFPQPNIVMVSSQADIMCFPSNQPYFHSALQATSHTFIWLCILLFGFERIHIQNDLNFSASSEWLFEFPQPKIMMVSSQTNIMCFPGNQPYFHSGVACCLIHHAAWVQCSPPTP